MHLCVSGKPLNILYNSTAVETYEQQIAMFVSQRTEVQCENVVFWDYNTVLKIQVSIV